MITPSLVNGFDYTSELLVLDPFVLVFEVVLKVFAQSLGELYVMWGAWCMFISHMVCDRFAHWMWFTH